MLAPREELHVLACFLRLQLVDEGRARGAAQQPNGGTHAGADLGLTKPSPVRCTFSARRRLRRRGSRRRRPTTAPQHLDDDDGAPPAAAGTPPRA